MAPRLSGSTDADGSGGQQRRLRAYLSGFGRWRSEEQTSELQSLMRLSYDVFCLKKKNNKSKPEIHNKQQINQETNVTQKKTPQDTRCIPTIQENVYLQ